MPESWAGAGYANGQLDFDYDVLGIKYIANLARQTASSAYGETLRLIVFRQTNT